jgi:hypothetical protein
MLKSYTNFKIMHNSNLSSEDFSCYEKQKQQSSKAPVKERKIIFFQSYLKASVVKLFLLIYLAHFLDYFKLLLF